MPDTDQKEKNSSSDNQKPAEDQQNREQEDTYTAYTRQTDEVVDHFETDPEKGLSASEAEQRLEKHGRNELAEEKMRSVWQLVLDQFTSVVIYILAAGMVLAFSTGRYPEGWALLAVIVVNAGIGFVSEWRARKSMAALRAMGRPEARVLREGEEKEIAVEEVVPGDIIVINPEDVIPADARLVSIEALRISEAALTGESVAVNKTTDPTEEDAPLAERKCMVYKGTTAQEGSGKAVVTATGMKTELGHISELASGESQTEAPLQKRLDKLGARLAYLSLGLAAVIFAIGLIVGRDMVKMIETTLALGVAMIPEGLPIVATIALARGMWLMAQRQALINRLTAVQTLGATKTICTDKTGTLTHNSMVLQQVITPKGTLQLDNEDGEKSFRLKSEDTGNGDSQAEDGEAALPKHALRIGVLCNNAKIIEKDDGEEGTRGDPTESALLKAGRIQGYTRDELLEDYPEKREVDFDPDVMMMATFHEWPGGDSKLVAVKGAPDRVLEVCKSIATGEKPDDSEELDDETRKEWSKRGEDLAAKGLRLLAAADKVVDQKDSEPYENLRFLGFLAMSDPPREDVRESIKACHRAGINVIMITGDQKNTARAIGEQTGIIEKDSEEKAREGKELQDALDADEQHKQELIKTRVYARVSPEQKLNLVKLLQEDGSTVAMTGDGVNDAPALKRADIGIAMGQRGTDAAKQVSDMVLKDDNFNSILAAVEQGRVIFGNIRKSVVFMLCTNLAEIIAVGFAAAINSPLPLLPLQILYLNVLTDVFPALALGVGKGGRDVLDRPPRPKDEGVLTKRLWMVISGWGVVLSLFVLGALYAGLHLMGLEENTAITISFLTLGFAKLFFVFNLREPGSKLWKNDIVNNPWMWAAWGVCLVLLVSAVYMPGLNDLLQTRALNLQQWGMVLGLAILPAILGQIWLQFSSGTSGEPKDKHDRDEDEEDHGGDDNGDKEK